MSTLGSVRSTKNSIIRRVAAVGAGTLIATLFHPLPAVAEPGVEQLTKRVDAASAELEILVEDYNAVNQDLEDLEKLQADTGRALEPLRGEAERSSAQVGDIAAALYRAGPGVTVTPIISGPTDTLVERLSVLDYLGREQDDAISDMSDTADALEAQKQAIDELEKERAELRARKSEARKTIGRDRERLQDLRNTAKSQGYRDNPGLGPPPIPDAGAAAAAVRFVHEQLGKPYRWGGSGPEGFDCSGLTSAAWGAAGVRLPHNAAAQFRAVPHVGRGELRPGDLVFYYGDIHHVGMFVGEGKIIHAPNEGQNVRVSGIDEAPVSGFGRPMLKIGR